MSIATDNLALITDLQRYANRRHGQKLVVDGHGGSNTRAALGRILPDFLPAPAPVITPAPLITSGLVDARSEACISTLQPEVQPLARQLIRDATAKGYEIKIISGTRTYAEQDELYRRARNGKDDDGDGRIDEADEQVTRAPAGYSNHNFGIAFDIGVFSGAAYLGESPVYALIAKLAKALAFEWGGDWSGFKDQPHFQLRPPWAMHLTEAAMLAEFRRRVNAHRTPI
jgi:peptidoglycan L-alanyl-D-glutamate endopeptidase CwlK